MIFHYLTANDGLSQNRVRCILRDSKENMWFGTFDGLNKYNGSQVTIYRNQVNNSKTISCERITDIQEDLDKNIWVATEDGLNLYNSSDGSFEPFKNNPSDNSSISGNYVNCIFTDKNHQVWFGIENGKEGLNKWNPHSKTFTRYKITCSNNIAIANAVTGIAQDKNGNFWIVSWDNAIFRFDPVTSGFTRYSDPVFDSFGTPKKLFVDNENLIWISTFGSGLFSFNPTSHKFIRYNSSGDSKGTSGKLVYNIIQEDSDNLLIAIDQGGINRFNKRTKLFEYISYIPNQPGGINNNGIWHLYKDREGILWVGTSGGGVNICNPNSEKFKLYKNIPGEPNSLSYDVVGSLYEDSKGLIWIATDGGGVSVFNPQTRKFKTYKNDIKDPFSIPCNVIRHVVEDNNHNFWFGTWDGGLIKQDHRTGRFIQYLPESRKPFNILGRHVWYNVVDHKGIIWLSITEFGVELLDPDKGIIKIFRPNPEKKGALSHKYTNFIYEDSHLNMWLCTNDGLNLYDSLTNSFKVFRGFPSNDIRSFVEDKEGCYWAGTINKGVIRFNMDGKIIKVYDMSSGLPSNLINGILEDNRKNIWVSTGNGISRISYQTGKIRNYTIGDGLQGKQFFIHSCLKTKSGEMYFGGFNGFNSFYPDSIKDNTFIPPVYINEFFIFNKTVPVGVNHSPLQNLTEQTKEIVLSWKQSVFTFGFVAINYTHPENNQYAYKMEGFDKDWNFTPSNRRLATYTNLDPGTYTFRVKASNNDGLWNEQGASVTITITPPFWRTWWFKISVFAILLMLGYIGLRLRIAGIKKHNLELEYKVVQRTEQLLSLNKELEVFSYSVSHDLRAPLRHIDGFIELLREKTMKTLDDQSRILMKNISEATGRMGTLIDSLLAFSRMSRQEMLVKDIDLNHMIKEVLEELSPDTENRNIQWNVHSLPHIMGDLTLIRSVFINLISNAIKFTRIREQTIIEIGYYTNSKQNIFFIRDNGVGFNPKYADKLFGVFQRLHRTEDFEGTGIGLANVKRIIERHGGKVWADSEENKGATFYFSLDAI